MKNDVVTNAIDTLSQHVIAVLFRVSLVFVGAAAVQIAVTYVLKRQGVTSGSARFAGNVGFALFALAVFGLFGPSLFLH